MLRAIPGRYAGLAALTAVALTAATGCTASAPSSSSASGSGGGNADKANLTYWYWGEGDAPGANDWMKARIADYEKLHPGVSIKLVPQSTDTLIGAFTTAAQTKTGPDIATQWATIPVLSQVWAGAVAPLSDYVPADQRSHWIGTQENTYKGKLYAMPLYLIGVPLAWNKQLFAKAGLTAPPTTFDELLADCGKLKAAGITPIGMGNKDGYFGAWFFSNYGKQNLDSVDQLKQAVIGKANITDPKYTGFYEPMHQLKSQRLPQRRHRVPDPRPGHGQVRLRTGGHGLGHGRHRQQVGQAARCRTRWASPRTPKWGTGKLADVYNTTQSSSAFITSWSPNKKAAAQFLTLLHEPANLDQLV